MTYNQLAALEKSRDTAWKLFSKATILRHECYEANVGAKDWNHMDHICDSLRSLYKSLARQVPKNAHRPRMAIQYLMDDSKG